MRTENPVENSGQKDVPEDGQLYRLDQPPLPPGQEHVGDYLKRGKNALEEIKKGLVEGEIKPRKKRKTEVVTEKEILGLYPEVKDASDISELRKILESPQGADEFGGKIGVSNIMHHMQFARNELIKNIKKIDGLPDSYHISKIPDTNGLRSKIVELLTQELQDKIEQKKTESDERITEKNFKMLQDEMGDLLFGESIGGNAGMATIEGKKYSCGAANGYANPRTGKIVMFGNIQDLDPALMKGNVEFTLRVAFGKPGFFKMKIVDFFHKSRFSERGLENINKAIKKYNKENEIKE